MKFKKTLDEQIEKYFKSNDFKIGEFIQFDKIPIPIFFKPNKWRKTYGFYIQSAGKIYNENPDKIKEVQ